MLGFCGVRVLGLGGTWGSWDVNFRVRAPGVLGFFVPWVGAAWSRPNCLFFLRNERISQDRTGTDKGFPTV